MLLGADADTDRAPEQTRKLLAELRRSATERAEAISKLSATVSRLEYQQRQSAREQVLGQIAAATSWELAHLLPVGDCGQPLGESCHSSCRP